MSKDFETIRTSVLSRLGSWYMRQGGMDLGDATAAASREVDELIDAARRAPEGAPAERPEVTWNDLVPGRLMVLTDRIGGKPVRHDVRIVKRGNRVGGRVTLRALTGSKEWVLYIDTQRSKDGWQSFRSPEQAAWDGRQSAARDYLNEVIGRTSGNRGVYEDDEVTLANIIRRARGEEEL